MNQSIRVVSATTSDDKLIDLNTFNNHLEIVAPTTLQSINEYDKNNDKNYKLPKVNNTTHHHQQRIETTSKTHIMLAGTLGSEPNKPSSCTLS